MSWIGQPTRAVQSEMTRRLCIWLAMTISTTSLFLGHRLTTSTDSHSRNSLSTLLMAFCCAVAQVTSDTDRPFEGLYSTCTTRPAILQSFVSATKPDIVESWGSAGISAGVIAPSFGSLSRTSSSISAGYATSMSRSSTPTGRPRDIETRRSRP